MTETTFAWVCAGYGVLCFLVVVLISRKKKEKISND